MIHELGDDHPAGTVNGNKTESLFEKLGLNIPIDNTNGFDFEVEDIVFDSEDTYEESIGDG